VTKRAAAPKREVTRQRLLGCALKLFSRRGVEATTMREIARAAGLSLGAAYYYFPSKEALMFAYYEDNQADNEAGNEALNEGTNAALPAPTTLRQRLGAIFHRKLDSVRPQRAMLASILGRLLDPGDPLSALSAQQRAVRERAVAVMAKALDGAGLPDQVAAVAAHALWLMQMASLLVCVHDDSAQQERTHGLVDDALDLLVPMLPLLATPIGQAMSVRVIDALRRAGIQVGAANFGKNASAER
jgi:AcrR family transcriptional regulator